MNVEPNEPTEVAPTTKSQFWSRVRILLIGGVALGLIVLMCVAVALVAYLRS